MKTKKYILLIQLLLLALNLVIIKNTSYVLIFISQIIILLITISNYDKITSFFCPLNIFLLACELSFTIKGIVILSSEKFSNGMFNVAFAWYILFLTGVFLGLKIKPSNRVISFYLDLGKRKLNYKKFKAFSFLTIPMVLIIYFRFIGTYNIGSLFGDLLQNRFLFQNSGGLYVQTFILSFLKVCVYVAFISLLKKYKYSQKKLIFTISLSLLLLITMSLGARGEIVFPIIGMAFIYERINKKLDMRKLAIIAIIIIIFSGWYGLLRDGEDTRGLNAGTTINNVLNRYVQLDNLIRLSNNPVEYKFGQSFKDFILSPLPRSIIPNKPYPFNSQMTSIYLPEQFSAKIVSDFTAISELYLNFGYFGILTGAFIFGIILKYAMFIFNEDKTDFFMILYTFFMIKPMSIFYGGMINSNANMMMILEFVVVSFLWMIISSKGEIKL